jgi:Zn-dependent peptidase ImmA (M78 family)
VRRGFKAQAERISEQARAALGLDAISPLDPWIYAESLGFMTLNIRDLGLNAKSLAQLLEKDSDSWSGMTLQEGNLIGIVLNPSHSLARQATTLAHELAHHVLKHVPSHVNVSETGLMLLSEYSDEAESEADWLGGAMLLPRDALFVKRRSGLTTSQIALEYGTSEQLCEWRLRMTGVDIQLRRAGHQLR